MNYHLRAVKGNQLARIQFEADSDRHARIICRDVYDNYAPNRELWTDGKVVAVAEDGTIVHTFSHCDSCNRITCEEGCGEYDN
jgi:hypothetical protein